MNKDVKAANDRADRLEIALSVYRNAVGDLIDNVVSYAAKQPDSPSLSELNEAVFECKLAIGAIEILRKQGRWSNE